MKVLRESEGCDVVVRSVLSVVMIVFVMVVVKIVKR